MRFVSCACQLMDALNIECGRCALGQFLVDAVNYGFSFGSKFLFSKCFRHKIIFDLTFSIRIFRVNIFEMIILKSLSKNNYLIAHRCECASKCDDIFFNFLSVFF